MSLLENIKEAWGWVGLDPIEIMAVNPFGNLLIKDKEGRYWRLCPEDVYCKVIADSAEMYEALLKDADFIVDWEMGELIRTATRKLGPLSEGRRYCLKIPAILGGAYGEDNLGTVPLGELILFSGDLAKQIKDLPDGAQIRLKVVD